MGQNRDRAGRDGIKRPFLVDRETETVDANAERIRT